MEMPHESRIRPGNSGNFINAMPAYIHMLIPQVENG
jgi:hypothetical protein